MVVSSEDVAAWFFQERGISVETLRSFGVGVREDSRCLFVTLPYANGVKERPDPRISPESLKEMGLRRFYFDKGTTPALFNHKDVSRDTVFLVEGETDTMRLWQELLQEAELGNADPLKLPGVVGLSGIDTWRPELAAALENAKKVFVILDNDEDYMVKAQVDGAWKKIRADLGSKARRLRLPDGVKDVCEFFDMHDMETLRLLASTGPGASRYRPLDFNVSPPPPNWLFDPLIAKGDVTLVTGPPGVGKSWLTMGATVAVIEEQDEFLGADVCAKGRVLYVDQENPHDVIFRRLKALGLSDGGMWNLRYLWNCGIRLDRDPDKFIDEALDFEPTLIVLDSLTRLHTLEENNAGEMATLFNNGIQPLARETGAAVLLIHHDNKQGNPRGSVDILASVDAAYQALPAGETNPGTFVLRQAKSRRRLGGDSLVIRVRDTEDGTIVLESDATLDPPF